MSSSQTPEHVAEQALRDKAELQAQIKCLQAQIDQLMEEDEGRGPFLPRRERNIDSKVIPKFEGQLDPGLFLEWLWTVESVFAYEDIPEANKVKLVALRLRKYASNWWANLVAKRVRQGKDKIRTWAKMKSKLKARFLPPTYFQSPYSQLPHLTQAFPTFDEVREFVQAPPKGQLFNKGSPSCPSNPTTPSNFFPQKDQAPQNSPLLQHDEQTFFKVEEENLEVCMMEEVDEDVENVEEGGLLDLRRSLPTTEEPPKDGGVLSSFFEPNPKAEPNESIVFNDSNLKPYSVNDKLENLRTNSFLEGENDVYLLGVHLRFFNPTSWELRSIRIHACQGSCWTLLFEFHDKRHVMEFYLARKDLRQSNGAIGTSSRTWPVFVPLVS